MITRLRPYVLLTSAAVCAALLLGASAPKRSPKAKRTSKAGKERRKAFDTDRDFDRYLKKAKELRKHRDTGGLEEEDVLRVLRGAGVFGGGAETGRGGHRSFAQGFRPFDVRVYKGIWRWPLNAGIVSSEYGWRWGRRHQGIDIAADEGKPIYAAAPGEVLYSDDKLRGYGNVVILRHDNETTSLYAHCDKLLVDKGEHVRIGQKIATLGSTGHSTGPHIHFEVRKESKPVNPRKIMPKARF